MSHATSFSYHFYFHLKRDQLCLTKKTTAPYFCFKFLRPFGFLWYNAHKTAPLCTAEFFLFTVVHPDQRLKVVFTLCTSAILIIWMLARQGEPTVSLCVGLVNKSSLAWK